MSRVAIALASVALALAAFFIGVRAVDAGFRRRGRRVCQVEITNDGNVPARYALRIVEPQQGLEFGLIQDGKRLPALRPAYTRPQPAPAAPTGASAPESPRSLLAGLLQGPEKLVEAGAKVKDAGKPPEQAHAAGAGTAGGGVVAAIKKQLLLLLERLRSLWQKAGDKAPVASAISRQQPAARKPVAPQGAVPLTDHYVWFHTRLVVPGEMLPMHLLITPSNPYLPWKAPIKMASQLLEPVDLLRTERPGYLDLDIPGASPMARAAWYLIVAIAAVALVAAAYLLARPNL
jgi:hypothetical protein